MADRAIIFRVEHHKQTGGVFYSAHFTRAFALDGIARRVKGMAYKRHVLMRCERDAVTFENERVLETREFNAKGIEVAP